MKTGLLMALLGVAGLGTNAMAYDLQCKTSSPNAKLVIVADGSDGSLDDLAITINSVTYGESTINVLNWREEIKTYSVDDNAVQAKWPMKDGKLVQIDLKFKHGFYEGTMKLSSAQTAPEIFNVRCSDLERNN
jgi:hypothetical protein